MKNGYSKWVVGHKITTHDTTGNYDLAVIETPAKVQGPPPLPTNPTMNHLWSLMAKYNFLLMGK